MDKQYGQLHTLSKNSPTEQIYLQTSKGIYEAGEDLVLSQISAFATLNTLVSER